MKNIVIYNFENRAVICPIPDGKQIQSIEVDVITGDEIVDILFTDGTSLHFDSDDSRIIGCYDGGYDVDGDEIERWASFKPTKSRTASYKRMAMFQA